MTTLQMIYIICTHPDFTNVVIGDEDDRTPINAIERLSIEKDSEIWNYHCDFDGKTILIWQ